MQLLGGTKPYVRLLCTAAGLTSLKQWPRNTVRSAICAIGGVPYDQVAWKRRSLVLQQLPMKGAGASHHRDQRITVRGEALIWTTAVARRCRPKLTTRGKRRDNERRRRHKSRRALQPDASHCLYAWINRRTDTGVDRQASKHTIIFFAAEHIIQQNNCVKCTVSIDNEIINDGELLRDF